VVKTGPLPGIKRVVAGFAGLGKAKIRIMDRIGSTGIILQMATDTIGHNALMIKGSPFPGIGGSVAPFTILRITDSTIVDRFRGIHIIR